MSGKNIFVLSVPIFIIYGVEQLLQEFDFGLLTCCFIQSLVIVLAAQFLVTGTLVSRMLFIVSAPIILSVIVLFLVFFSPNKHVEGGVWMIYFIYLLSKTVLLVVVSSIAFVFLNGLFSRWKSRFAAN